MGSESGNSSKKLAPVRRNRGESLQPLCGGGDLLALASAFRPGDSFSQSSLGILGPAPFFLRRLFIVRPFLDLLEEPILGADALEALQEAFARFAGPYGYLDRQTDVSDSS